MGRKKRAAPVANAPPPVVAAASVPTVNHPPPPPPPAISNPSKKAKSEERYLVKKYRPEKHYDAMDAFVKYTKSHRMLDAAYVRSFKGTTPEKPYVFSTRVGGLDLGWGRGKTREAAMDAACRAAFCLVAAHGYNHFPLDDDCLTQEPQDVLPPPPPPLPPGLPPGYPLPPLPPGYPPPPPSVAGEHMMEPPPAPAMIPQPKALSDTVPVASSLSVATVTAEAGGETEKHVNANNTASVSLSLSNANSTTLSTGEAATPSKKKLKGGLTLVFDSEEDGPNELCMEERRASLDRYQKLLRKARPS